MRAITVAVVAIAMSVAAPAVQAQKQLRLFVSGNDQNGTPAATLEPGNLAVLENGIETKILKVEPITWAVKLQLLLDNGVGLGSQNINQLRTGVKGLLDALPEGTEVTLVTTAPQPRQVVKATKDRQAQLKGIDILSPDSGAGRFIESLSEAVERIEKDKSDFFPVIVAVGTTAGENDVLEGLINRMMKRLQQRPTTIHVIM